MSSSSDATSRNAGFVRRVKAGIRQRTFYGLSVVAICVVGGAVTFQVAQSMLRHLVFKYEVKGWAEGFFLYNALQLSRGENMYPDPDNEAATGLPYGFLYQLLQAPFVRIFGPQLWIGRGISILAAVLSLGWVFRTATKRAGSVVAGLVGVFLSCAEYFSTGGSWDWGHADSLYMALGFGALMCVEPPLARRGWRIAAAVLLSCASCCAKQTGVGFVLAVATTLLFTEWRLAVLYMVVTGLVMVSTVAIWQALSDGHFLQYTVGMFLGDPYALSRLIPLTTTLLRDAPVLVIAGVWQLKRDPVGSAGRDPIVWALFWVGSASVAAVVKAGGWLNSLMPVYFLLSVPAGVLLGKTIATRKPGAVFKLLATGAVLGQLLLTEFLFCWNAAQTQRHLRFWYERGGQLIEAELRNPQERVFISHRVSFAVRTGHRLYDSTWFLRPTTKERLKSRIADHFFDKALVPLEHFQNESDEVLQLLAIRYRVERIIQPEVSLIGYTPMLVFVPRKAGDSG